jgi:putative oxygen-independent coproporphyrinogen III oxidase
MLKFKVREPIGSSTYPMPGDAVELDRTLAALHESPKDHRGYGTIYLHIPFCDQICSFCGFNKQVSTAEIKAAYVAAVHKEIEAYAAFPYVRQIEFKAVYIGGGTPNSLTKEDLSGLVRALRTKFNVAADAEISTEGTPQNFTKEMNDMLLAAGINRISTGVQTFNTEIRREHLHMNHTREELLGFIETIRESFPNFNLDLIYNLPLQTDEIWRDDVATALRLGSKHLSILPLVLLENTVFYSDFIVKGKYPPPDQDNEIKLFNHTVAALRESAFSDHYSMRDWSQPNFECRYITTNAQCGQILALGAGAHGYLAGQTYRNVRSTQRYIESMRGTNLPLEGQRFATPYEEMQRFMVMGLRQNRFDTSRFEVMFGKPLNEVFGEKLKVLIDSGYLVREGAVLTHTDSGLIWGNNLRTYFEEQKACTVGYADTRGVGSTGKDHYSSITRIKASGDVEANIIDIHPQPRVAPEDSNRGDKALGVKESVSA